MITQYLSLVLIVAMTFLIPQLAYSQPGDPSNAILNATGMTPAADKLTLQPLQNECGPVFSCAYFVYSSPNTLVISGDESIPSISVEADSETTKLTDNIGLWKIVDYFKAKGFKVDAVFLKELPDDFESLAQDQYRIIMSKSGP